MKTTKQPDTILVYDRYYNQKPKAALQTLKKSLYCTALCVCAMLFLINEYRMPVDLWTAAGICAGFAAFFCVLFTFVRKRAAVPIIVLLAAVIVFFRHEELRERISYFTDTVLMRLDGTIFSTAKYTFHTESQLLGTYEPCADGVLLGISASSCVFSMLTAGSMFGKPIIYPSLVTFILLNVPVAAAGNFDFNLWIIPVLALYFGAVALSKSYYEGAAIKKGFFGSFHADTLRTEREFHKKVKKAQPLKRAGMNGIYYSKYMSSACWAAAVITASAVIANCFAPVREGFDYSGFYAFLNNIGQSSGITSPFENGPLSEYFTDLGIGNSSLSVISPGTSDTEILRVTSSGGAVYIRGDIGIDFTGTSWTSPVNDGSDLWENGTLGEVYRPAEMRIFQSIEQSYREESEYEIPDDYSISECEVTVNYLCETDIVFLPSYTSEFGFFDDEMFDVYGDYTVRVNEAYEKINTVKCIALVPPLTYSGEDSEDCIARFEYFRSIAESYPMDVIFDSYFDADGLYSEYKNYVYETYLDVPQSIEADIHDFLSENGFLSTAYADGRIDADSAYRTAVQITDFLMSNYTYSLDAKNNSGNPVMSFLNETKSGHCALYASAMTLMMRELGVPARYCTGFIVPETPSEQYAVLRSRNLHAWCEVYFDDIGWVTFDPTSASLTTEVEISGESEDSYDSSDSLIISISDSYGDSGENSDDGENASDCDDGSSENTTEFSPDNVSDEPTYPRVNVLPIVLTVMCAAAVVSAAVFIFVRLNKFDKKVRRTLKTMCKTADSETIYGKILGVLALCRLTPASGELPEKFYSRCEDVLQTPIISHKDVLLKAAFGTPSDNIETAELARLLEGLFAAADKKLHIFDRLKLRRLIVSKK